MSNSSRLDANQVLKEVFDNPNDALRVIGAGGALVTDNFDEIALTYITSGNGTGEVGTATYKLAGATVAVLTLTYNASSQLTNVTRS